MGGVSGDGFPAHACRQHPHDGPEVPIMKTQDLVPMVIDPFGQAARSALAMQSSSFEGVAFNSNGSAGRGKQRPCRGTYARLVNGSTEHCMRCGMVCRPGLLCRQTGSPPAGFMTRLDLV